MYMNFDQDEDMMSGTAVNQLRQNDVNSIRHMTTNINKELENIDDETVQDMQEKMEREQYRQYMEKMQQEIDDLKNSKDKMMEHFQEQENKMSANVVVPFAIEGGLLLLLYILLSTNKVKSMIENVIKINLTSDVGLNGIIIYGILIAILFVATKYVIFKYVVKQ